MGYSHYLRSERKSLSQEAFASIAHAVTQALFRMDKSVLQTCLLSDTVVATCLSKHDPEALERSFLTEGVIRLTLGEAETLVIPRHKKTSLEHWFVFCKTPRHSPEDAAISALMMLAANASKGEVQFSSDGSFEDLAEARKTMAVLTGALQDRNAFRLEAAQCLWEEFLRLQDIDQEFTSAFESLGAQGMRAMAREPDMLDACIDGYDLLEKRFDGVEKLLPTYDWDYVPVFVKACVDPYVGLKKDWAERLIEACASTPSAPSM